MFLTRRSALLGATTTAVAAGLTLEGATGGLAAPATDAPPVPPPPAAFPIRLSDIVIRDPFVVADPVSGLYHLYAANRPAVTGVAGAGTMVYRSRNLRDWSVPTVVFQATSGLWAASGAWAPEVHRWRGRWVLFVTLYDKKKPLVTHQPGANGLPVQIPQHRRGTVIAVADSLLGPFTVVDPARPVAPATFMTLDGTLTTDEHGKPWMVYAHEWVQKIDGTMEAVPLKPDLSGAAGRPVHLFKGSDPAWIGAELPAPSANQILAYVTDGPEVIRLPGGALAMLWSTYAKNQNDANGTVGGDYVQTWALSPSGRLKGPWTQQRPLLRRGTGHGMVFRTLATRTRKARPMLVVHRGGATTHAKLYEIELKRTGLVLGKQRTDLDGPPKPEPAPTPTPAPTATASPSPAAPKRR